jgi:hypothetical protein
MQIDAVAVNLVEEKLNTVLTKDDVQEINPVISSRFSVPSWFVLTTGD